jgi:hypothetical protein
MGRELVEWVQCPHCGGDAEVRMEVAENRMVATVQHDCRGLRQRHIEWMEVEAISLAEEELAREAEED